MSSSTSVRQGLQSCLEPCVIEPRVLRLKLAPPGSNPSPPSACPSTSNNWASYPSHSEPQDQEKPLTNLQRDTKENTTTNMGGCGWSFLQALSHTSHCDKTEDPEDKQVYVHPTVKRSSSMLSEKGLEMCTESLGSETGSNAGEISDDISLFCFESSTSFSRHDNTLGVNTNCVARRVNRACNFPPPLTSITDFGGVHVRPHREDGRLILEAVASPSPRPYFHAERSDGRLRLRLFESFTESGCDDENDHGEGVDEEWSHDEEDETQNQEGCDEEDTGVEEELEEYVDKVEDEMGVAKFARPSRCKESGNRDIFGDAYLSFPRFLSISE